MSKFRIWCPVRGNYFWLSLFQDEASLKGKDKDLAKIDDGFKRLQNQSQQDAETYAAAQKHFHAVSAGLSSNQDGDDASLNEQLLGKILCSRSSAWINVNRFREAVHASNIFAFPYL